MCLHGQNKPDFEISQCLIQRHWNPICERTLLSGIKSISNQDQIVSLSPESAHLETDREQNIIIHGLKEDEVSDTQLVSELFTATATQHTPSVMNILGPKKDGKIRPLMLRMKSKDEKEEFMSKLWMLKNVRTRFKYMSISIYYRIPPSAI